MAECSASKKWSCSFCTYLNYDASIKCTLCATPRSGCLTIEQIACLSPNGTAKESAVVSDDRWGCPSCTYLNCLRTKKCVQCLTDRPLRYGSDPAVNLSVIDCSGKSSPITATTSLAKELNKWMCPTCTFSNWPNALRCTMCASPRQGNRSQITTSRPHTPISPSRSKPFTDEVDSVSAVFSSTAIQGVINSPTEPLSQGPLDLYQRRFAVGSSTEALFFKAASAIGSRDIQMVNVVVEYLINEGNVARRLTGFESRLLNARSGGIRYEKGDSLIDLAKKCDCPDLVKLMKRVAPFDDKLPCAVNCASRARIWAKIAQLIAFRNGVFNAQFIAHPYNFNILKLPLKESDCNMEIMKCIVKPSPGIPPSFVHLDCFDMVGGSVVGRPMSVVMKNRMDAQSLLDAVFQTMFGVCDRFNLLRSALKYTLTRSSHHFKPRWVERTQRMYRECGMSVDDNSLELEWEEIMGSVSDDAEPFEPIHIWALSHVVCRPIIVVSMEENTNVAELQNLEYIPPKERSPAHHFDGIYLPTLWNAAPVTRSPLIIGHQNGLFYAFVITDGLYKRDHDVQRFVRLRRPRRFDCLFRYLTHAELENANFLSQFISFGQCSTDFVTIRRDPHPFLYETLLFYGSWVHAVKCCLFDAPGGFTVSQIEREIDSPNLPELFENLSVFSVKAASTLKTAPPSHRRREAAKIAENPLAETEAAILQSDEEEDDDQ